MQQAGRLESARWVMSIGDGEVWNEEPPWPRRLRIFFILSAATACWALPALLVYWLAH